MDAYYAMKALSENPEKFGPFFRKLIPKVDEDLEPKVPVNSMSAVFLSCGLTGMYLIYFYNFRGGKKEAILTNQNLPVTLSNGK